MKAPGFLPRMKTSRRLAAMTLVEMACAVAITSAVLAGASAGVVALQKSFAGYKQYAAGMNDGTRVVDYVSRDLRNALRVSRRTAGTAAVFKSGFFQLTENDQLVIFLPDYYESNVPDNASGSDFKSPRLDRSNLTTGATFFPYLEVVALVGATRVPKYPGELEVRYFKQARSVQDPTQCYFREEYDGGAIPVLRSRREIAQRAAAVRVTVTALNPSRFRILTSFSPEWSGEAKRMGTLQASTVKLFNFRRD